MRFTLFSLAAVLCTTDVLAFQPVFFGSRSPTHLFDAAIAEPDVAAEKVVQSTAPVSGLTKAFVRTSIDRLTKENFSKTLSEIEPFLLHDAGASIYAKSMRRIERNAKELGVEVPAKFAFEAACTAKRRAKQDEFIQGKEAERLEAEAAAAEAAAAEAAAKEAETETAEAEEEAAVEEPELVAA